MAGEWKGSDAAGWRLELGGRSVAMVVPVSVTTGDRQHVMYRALRWTGTRWRSQSRRWGSSELGRAWVDGVVPSWIRHLEEVRDRVRPPRPHEVDI